MFNFMENRLSKFLVIVNKLGSMIQKPKVQPSHSITIPYSYATLCNILPLNVEDFLLPKSYLIDRSYGEVNKRKSLYMEIVPQKMVETYYYEPPEFMADSMMESIYNRKYIVKPQINKKLGSRLQYEIELPSIYYRDSRDP